MTRYIAVEANLKMMMNLLRDRFVPFPPNPSYYRTDGTLCSSKNIQFEAFHVFKVFVANPNKPPQIAAILKRNKEKLLSFLKDFHNDREGECLVVFYFDSIVVLGALLRRVIELWHVRPAEALDRARGGPR